MPAHELWPLPDRGAQRRARNVLGATLAALGMGVVAVVAALTDGGAGGDGLGGGRERSVPERLRAIEAGTPEHLGVAVYGSAPWCPRYPDWGSLTLTPGAVVHSQGVERSLPIGELVPVRVRAAGTVQAPLRLPRRAWVLDVAGAAGSGSIAARSLEDLALVGAVAGWPPPPDWPAPSLGTRPRRDPGGRTGDVSPPRG